MIIQIVCDESRPGFQIRDWQIGCFPLRIPRKAVAFPHYCEGTSLYRLRNEFTSIRLFPGIGQKSIPRLHGAAVNREMLPPGSESVKRMEIKTGFGAAGMFRYLPPRPGIHTSPLLFLGGAAVRDVVLPTGASYGTFCICRMPCITLLKTGAATVPP